MGNLQAQKENIVLVVGTLHTGVCNSLPIVYCFYIIYCTLFIGRLHVPQTLHLIMAGFQRRFLPHNQVP